ncbi:hypothetical protein BpV2_109c [Bathycoccus sp. RCC1105 virus BpV2]|nr:hypothetical protein BpV2_109c [Bathycoccus sp. RCC1105 virus BpV2]
MKIASAITSLFPFMILENLGSVTNMFYHLHRNETMYKLVYISRHVDLLWLGYVLKGGFDYTELVFNFLSIVIIYKSNIHDKKYLDVNLIISVIKSAFGMSKLHYLVSLYFWFLAFIIHYDTLFGRYTDIIVNLLLCPPQYLLKNNILSLQ